jgi:hypothetical protein
VRFLLQDGETLVIAADDLERVYENLWRLAPRSGAVALAGVLNAVMRERPPLRPPIDLTEEQTAVLREAVEMPAP